MTRPQYGLIDHDEFERLRRLIPERPDWHLWNHGVWARRYRDVRGYDARSACLATGGLSSDFEDLCEEVDERSAEISDVILDSMPIEQRIAISHVYESAVWRFNRPGMLEQTLVTAAATFWTLAQRKGLL